MAWDKGWNFRATAAFVTDGADETYSLGSPDDDYPVTRNGVTFGWEDGPADDSRDRDATVDRRLAGINFHPNDGTQKRFRVDLPATGDYNIRLAIGDTGTGQGYQYVEVLDTTTQVHLIDDTNGTAIDNYDDATGVNRTEAAWPTDNAVQLETFSTTILRLRIGPTTAQAGSTTLAHLFLNQVAAAAEAAGALIVPGGGLVRISEPSRGLILA